MGVYDQPLENEQQVHNLEHGHILVQHKGLPPATVGALEALALEEQNRQWMIVAPKPDMDHALALTAWGRLLTCADGPEAGPAVELARQFTDTFRDKSPRESIPGTARAGGGPAPGAPGAPSPEGAGS